AWRFRAIVWLPLRCLGDRGRLAGSVASNTVDHRDQRQRSEKAFHSHIEIPMTGSLRLNYQFNSCTLRWHNFLIRLKPQMLLIFEFDVGLDNRLVCDWEDGDHRATDISAVGLFILLRVGLDHRGAGKEPLERWHRTCGLAILHRLLDRHLLR